MGDSTRPSGISMCQVPRVVTHSSIFEVVGDCSRSGLDRRSRAKWSSRGTDRRRAGKGGSVIDMVYMCVLRRITRKRPRWIHTDTHASHLILTDPLRPLVEQWMLALHSIVHSVRTCHYRFIMPPWPLLPCAPHF
jgi:hypothetical protein